MVVHPTKNYLIVVESDHRAYNEKEKQVVKEFVFKSMKEEQKALIDEGEITRSAGGPGKWASCFRIVDPVE
jgi:hypothetical protein